MSEKKIVRRGSGPFVMNEAQEIRQAISDYQTGKMGRLS